MQLDDPVLFIEHRLLYRTEGIVHEPVEAIPFGVAATRRRGDDITIVATSRMSLLAVEAADELATIGISAEVIDPRTLVPFDIDTVVRSVERTNRLLVVHEEVRRSGFGGEIVAQVIEHAFDYLDAPPIRLGAAEVPMPFGVDLEAAVVPQVATIVQTARGLVGR